MPANFPSNPDTNATYVYNGIRWRFDGYSWQLDLETGLPIGATGATGAPGTGGGGGTGNVSINFDGGTPSSTYTTGPVFDCGGVT
jgi:hypothetical protein